MTPHHITEADYAKLADAVHDADYPARHDHGDHEMVSLVETIPGIDLDIHLWESGEWGHSGIDEYGRYEMIWEPTHRKYTVDRVWLYNNDGSDRPHDFDRAKFEAMLNWGKGVKKSA